MDLRNEVQVQLGPVQMAHFPGSASSGRVGDQGTTNDSPCLKMG